MIMARRIAALESAVFSEMNELKTKVQARGIDVINLGIGSPDQPPAPHVKEALIRAMDSHDAFGYALSDGLPIFKQTVARWYQERFGVELEPENEVLSLMGSQDGLGHIFLALINPGEKALIPDPGYPIYTAGLLLAEGVKIPMALEEKRGFLPDLEAIPPSVAHEARMMVLNYPNNPVAATADLDFFERVVYFARKFDILVLHDIAYSELAYDGYKPISFLQVPGAKDIGVEFHSVSKTYNLAGCRLGMAVGNRHILQALNRIKSNIDYGVFKAVQMAAVAALSGPQDSVKANAEIYQRRRDVLIDGLAALGWKIPKPKASMFVWARLPAGYHDSKKFAVNLLERTGILVIPGVAFGEMGENYVRIALVCSENLLNDAVARIGKVYTF